MSASPSESSETLERRTYGYKYDTDSTFETATFGYQVIADKRTYTDMDRIRIYNRSASKEKLHYHQLVLVNRDALRDIPVVPLTPTGKPSETSTMRASTDTFTNKVNEKERQSYGCSFTAELRQELMRFDGLFGGPRFIHTRKVMAQYKINLTMTHPPEGLTISSMEFKSYWDRFEQRRNARWYHSNFNKTALHEIEKRNRQCVANFTEESITLEQLRKACLSFIYSSSLGLNRATVVRDSILEDIEAVLDLESKSILPVTVKSAMKTFHAHLPNEPDNEVPVLDMFKKWSRSNKRQ
ncbi:hypothetical protein FOL47_000794 [Perkinsus chesapeaki]|uniref:Uncharacterized protein n=1 Tax=Perkinsus chesapeaki TaxID=330153 RepID=A0A7J6MMN2_PERCH|nr:hypothetical protein FOL47_000794 [Perkinsus chesapeaki]